jgi:hypothetical protein
VPDLILHARNVPTVFDLLGHDENDMTAALGWGLARNSALLRAFVATVASAGHVTDDLAVELQLHDATDRGFTDIELRSAGLHVIVEAKRGWSLPSEAQLRRYEARFAAAGAKEQRFVVLTQNGAEQVVRHRLGTWSPPEPIAAVVLGWSNVLGLAERAARTGSPVERHLAHELASYLRGVADMRDTNSNRVWVVALTRQAWEGWPADLTAVAEVEQHRLYHYPSEGSYVKVVPNYVGFRYDGRLQSVHHVDGYELADTPHGHVPGAPALDWDMPHFLLRLGPPMRPDHSVRTGGLYGSARHWADLDLLLTSATVHEAVDATKNRRPD